MKTITAATFTLALLFMLSIANVSALANPTFGGKSGDWIEYDMQQPFSSASDQTERIDFLNVSGTNVTVQTTSFMGSTGSLTVNRTETIDLTSQEDFLMPLFSARVYFVPGGLGINDSVYLGELFGEINITGETTRNYLGVDRRVIFANFAKQPNNYTLYWDKQTGVLTEGYMTLGAASSDVFVTATSMWGTQIWWWILWIVIIIVIALGVLSSRRKIHAKASRRTETQPDQNK